MTERLVVEDEMEDVRPAFSVDREPVLSRICRRTLGFCLAIGGALAGTVFLFAVVNSNAPLIFVALVLALACGYGARELLTYAHAA
ncbi:MAG: hypothetical protein R3F54_28785 [Alphaproteobacteria bacterium]